MSSPTMRIITTTGVEAVEVPDELERSLVAGHANAIRHFLDTGSTDSLMPYRSLTVAGHTLQTDPDAIEVWAAEGELDFEDIYDQTGR